MHERTSCGRPRRLPGILLGLLVALPAAAQTPDVGGVGVNLGGGEPGSYARLLLLFAAAALAPAVLAVITSFARIAIVLFFLRAGLGSNDIPPTIVVMGLALFLTVFTMGPQIDAAYAQAVAPYMAGEIELPAAAESFMAQLRGYMEVHARDADLAVFGAYTPPAADGTVSMKALVPAFVLSELRAAFLTGFIIYLPFLVIDLVVAGTLASTGLLGLPATAVSLPFKVMLFVMVDGWALLAQSLLATTM